MGGRLGNREVPIAGCGLDVVAVERDCLGGSVLGHLRLEGLAEAVGASLTGLTVIVKVLVELVRTPSQAGGLPMQSSGSPRSVTLKVIRTVPLKFGAESKLNRPLSVPSGVRVPWARVGPETIV